MVIFTSMAYTSPKADLKFKQKLSKINVKDFILAQLAGQYQLFRIIFHVQTNCSRFVEICSPKAGDKNYFHKF